jgi:microcompartment protein CcmL/EutN
MEKRSLGLIETWGWVPALEAADAGVKAANVVLLGWESARMGLITVKFGGDVGAVQAAVSSGAAAAARVGRLVATHVIPRPDRQLNRTTAPRPSPPAGGPSRPIAAALPETQAAPDMIPVPEAASAPEPGPPKPRSGPAPIKEKQPRRTTPKKTKGAPS